MRAIPSLSVSAVSDWQHHIPGVIASVCTGINVTTQTSKKVMGINVTQASNATHSGAKASNLRAASSSSSRLTFSSEL